MAEDFAEPHFDFAKDFAKDSPRISQRTHLDFAKDPNCREC